MAASVKFGLCLVLALSVPSVIEAKGSVKFKGCNQKFMEILVYHPKMNKQVFRPFSQMRADKACEPQMFEDKAILRLPLDDAHRCGVTEIHNLRTGLRTYLTKVTIDDDGVHRSFQMKCDVQDKESLNRTRRNVLPAGFQEEEVLEIRPMEKKVQPPQLGVAVRQGGQLVTGELNVNPGTPLQMDVFMDEQSVPIYGLLVSHMLVSDTRSQEETIIFNGCSVDPYLFENFNTVDGDFLSAKFRAFKFPESTYVQFRGTVSVCLDKCRGVECSNGVVGFGRKRRAVAELPADPNKVFEVKLSTYIKVDYQDNKAEELDIKTPLLAAMSESPLSEAAADSNALPPKDASSGLEVAREEIRTFTVVEEMSSASSVPVLSLTLVAFCLSLFYFH